MAGAGSCFCISTASSLTSCISNSGVEVVDIFVLDLVTLIVVLFASSSSTCILFRETISCHVGLLTAHRESRNGNNGGSIDIFQVTLNDKSGVYLIECTLESMLYGVFLCLYTILISEFYPSQSGVCLNSETVCSFATVVLGLNHLVAEPFVPV